MSTPLLHVSKVKKQYTRGRFKKQVTFNLEADFKVDKSTVIGVMGPNGSGKTTLFELITGSNMPTSGEVVVNGQNIHNVRYGERDRLAIHYHQSYQVRAIKRTKPSFMLDRCKTAYPQVHLFDEPQFNVQDGYIGFMLDFFRKLRADGRLVFLCLHPNEPYHIDILREVCERFIFVQKGVVTHAPNFDTLVKDERVRAYLGKLAPAL
jgi:ABC-type branched-subunit amino acid transport system ATPase component